MGNKLRVMAASKKFSTGLVFIGISHSHAEYNYEKHFRESVDKSEHEDGFMLNDGSVVSRKKAYEVAKQALQLLYESSSVKLNSEMVRFEYEDIYNAAIIAETVNKYNDPEWVDELANKIKKEKEEIDSKISNIDFNTDKDIKDIIWGIIERQMIDYGLTCGETMTKDYVKRKVHEKQNIT